MAENESRKTERFRFHVYPNNKAVLKWIKSQMNLSASLSHIIIDAIQSYGYRDIMANEVEDVDKVKRGRPPKAEVMRNEPEQAKEPEIQAEMPKPQQAGVTPTATRAAAFFGD